MVQRRSPGTSRRFIQCVQLSGALLFVGELSGALLFVGAPVLFLGEPVWFVGEPLLFVGEPLSLVGELWGGCRGRVRLSGSRE